MLRLLAGAVLAAFAASCGAGRPAPLAEALVTGDQPPAVTLAVDRTSLPSREVLVATVTVINRSADSVELHFLTTQRYDFAFTDAAGHEVYRWASDMMFGQSIGELALGPADRRVFVERLRAPAEPGVYRLAGTIVATGSPLTASTLITVTR